ncbi:MAG: YraN family protein [Chloroflexi bacterium]|nr:YraN family protein [Chloroflexota bacterium]
MPDTRETGQIGERSAERELRRMGYQIITRNYRTRRGEVDLIARDGETLVFVEVKTRLGGAYGTPEEAITPKKQAHLISAAQTYMQETDSENAEWRIDVVVIQPGKATVHKNAVESPTE